LIKELVRRGNGFVELTQFNPEVTARVGMADVQSIELVLGELI
jgi:hypothetical protein